MAQKNFPSALQMTQSENAEALRQAVVLSLDAQGKKTFTGREEGEALRARWNLDGIDKVGASVRLTASSGVIVSSSFFIGLLAPSVRREQSAAGFWSRFEFDAPDAVKQTMQSVFPRILLARANSPASVSQNAKQGLEGGFEGEWVFAERRPAPSPRRDGGSLACAPKTLDFAALGEMAFTGRESGSALRKDWGLDELDRLGQGARLAMPSSAVMSSSFARGLLEPSMRAAGGQDEFWARWSAEGNPALHETVASCLHLFFESERLGREQKPGAKKEPQKTFSALKKTASGIGRKILG